MTTWLSEDTIHILLEFITKIQGSEGLCIVAHCNLCIQPIPAAAELWLTIRRVVGLMLFSYVPPSFGQCVCPRADLTGHSNSPVRLPRLQAAGSGATDC